MPPGIERWVVGCGLALLVASCTEMSVGVHTSAVAKEQARSDDRSAELELQRSRLKAEEYRIREHAERSDVTEEEAAELERRAAAVKKKLRAKDRELADERANASRLAHERAEAEEDDRQVRLDAQRH